MRTYIPEAAIHAALVFTAACCRSVFANEPNAIRPSGNLRTRNDNRRLANDTQLDPNLVYLGDIPPKSAFPLQLCEGNCKHAGHCADGLVCFFDTGNETAVPGCEGYPVGANYCILQELQPEEQMGLYPAPDDAPELKETPFQLEMATVFPSASSSPSSGPSSIPSTVPSTSPSSLPTGTSPVTVPPPTSPSAMPSSSPSSGPSSIPSTAPSTRPSVGPSAVPSVPSKQPSSQPSLSPSSIPTYLPSGIPSLVPSGLPSGQPSSLPSQHPSVTPGEPTTTPTTLAPTLSSHPSESPSRSPSTNPSSEPSSIPSTTPSNIPSVGPSAVPSMVSSKQPSRQPSLSPSSVPSGLPSSIPSFVPSGLPSGRPSSLPSQHPSVTPGAPTVTPTTLVPSLSSYPSESPSRSPSTNPSSKPSSIPSTVPSNISSMGPSAVLPLVPSGQPTLAPKHLVSFGGNPPFGAFPLQRCTGDCDFDSDRGSGGVPVPGCIGGTQDTSRTDYCIVDPFISKAPTPVSVPPTSVPSTPGPTHSFPTQGPQAAPSTSQAPTRAPISPSPTGAPQKRLVSFGGTPPASAFPLQQCEGDCDLDSNCDLGLVCFQRGPREPVPGCIGVDNSRTDYCILAPTTAPTPSVPTPTSLAPTPTPSSFPTPGSTPPSPVAVPTLPPSPVAIPTFGPTLQPSFPAIRLVSYGSSPPSKVFPLQRCAGDCDFDSDRGPGVPVPTCLGGEKEMSRTDYCVPGPSSAPSTPIPTFAPPTGDTPPPKPTPEPSTANPTSTPMAGHKNLISFGGTPPASAFPLQQCEGDCDDSSDRDAGVAVPGCLNGEQDMSRTDYCIPSSVAKTWAPSPSPRQMTPSPGTIIRQRRQLKLFWEEGYDWQEEDFERKWCMHFDYQGLPGTGMCWYGLERRPCNPDQIYVAKCNSDPQQRFDLILLSNNNSEDIFLIQVPNKNACLEMQGNSIFLRPCNLQNSLQQWKTLNGSLAGRRFEIVPSSRPTHCVTQAHHPKAGEVVELYKCSVARSPEHITSFWHLYG